MRQIAGIGQRHPTIADGQDGIDRSVMHLEQQQAWIDKNRINIALQPIQPGLELTRQRRRAFRTAGARVGGADGDIQSGGRGTQRDRETGCPNRRPSGAQGGDPHKGSQRRVQGAPMRTPVQRHGLPRHGPVAGEGVKLAIAIEQPDLSRRHRKPSGVRFNVVGSTLTPPR